MSVAARQKKQFNRRVGGAVVGGFLLWAVLLSGWMALAQERNPEVSAIMSDAKRYYWGVGVEQDYTRALALYEQAAERGDVEANFIAGGMYYTGKGTEINQFKAFKFLNYAASKGTSTPDSQRALAQFYLLGSVVPQNYEKAVELFEQATAAGDTSAMLELGFLYFVGKGVEQDHRKALELFEQAALQNNHMAQYNMGIMWYTGNGVDESDLLKAYAWFSVGAINDSSEAAAARDYLKTVLSQRELEQAQREAARIYQKIHPSIKAE